MNSGVNNPGYITDESAAGSSTDSDDEGVADIVGTADSVAAESDTNIPASDNIPKQGTSDSTDGGNVSTLSFLQKMAGVQDSFARQLDTLTKKCKKWEQRALLAEREEKAAEKVILKMADLAEQNANSGVTTQKKSVGFKGVKNPPMVATISSPSVTDDDEVDQAMVPTKGLDSLERDDLIKNGPGVVFSKDINSRKEGAEEKSAESS